MFLIGQLIFNSLLYSDKIDYLIIGNKYSSNFGNANYRGRLVNHQFDKTIQFVERVNDYIKNILMVLLNTHRRFLAYMSTE